MLIISFRMRVLNYFFVKIFQKWQFLLRHFIFNHLNQFFINPPLSERTRTHLPSSQLPSVLFFIQMQYKYYHYYFIIVDVVIGVVIIAMFHLHSIRGRIFSSHLNGGTHFHLCKRAWRHSPTSSSHRFGREILFLSFLRKYHCISFIVYSRYIF